MRNLIIVAALLVSTSFGWAQAAPDGSPGQIGGNGQARQWQRGPGVSGTITAVDGGKITVKTPDGQTAQVGTSPETQFRKDRQPAALADFKVGDQIFVRGEPKDGVWQAQMVAARAGGPGGDFRDAMGKRFIAGEVKAINGTRLTVLRPDGATQEITVDENTSFRKDKESITLADVKVGDHVFGRGELKNDVFVPAELNLGQPPTMRPRSNAAPASN